MKKFEIMTAKIMPEKIETESTHFIIEAAHGKAALHKFQQMRIYSTGLFEYHKTKGRWIMTSTYGQTFIAMEVK